MFNFGYGCIFGLLLSLLVMCFALTMSSCDRDNKYEAMLKQCEESSIYQCEIKAVTKGDGHE